MALEFLGWRARQKDMVAASAGIAIAAAILFLLNVGLTRSSSRGSLLAAFCASIAGFAFVLVGAAVLLQFLAPALVAPVLVMGSLIVQGIGTYAVRDHILAAALALCRHGDALGLPIGLAVLALGPARAVVAGVGLLLVVYGGYTPARRAVGWPCAP